MNSTFDIGVIVTLVLALMGAAAGYGGLKAVVATLRAEVKELRDTYAKTLERVGRLEGDVRSMNAVNDFSGRVGGRDRG